MAFPVNPDAAQAMMSHYADPGTYPVDARGVAYSMAYFMTKHLGTGQYYLVTLTDKEDKPLDGSKLYHLHIPPNVPVRQYWSITIYDRKTHALLKGVPYFSRASTSAGLQKNTDGSVDLYFGPKAPAGKESNWIPTNPERGFELMARFYGPEKDFFDKTWKIGDVEEVK